VKSCISEATTMPSTFAEDVANFAEAGWQGMEVWLTKLETHLESHSLADTRKLLADNGMTAAAAAYQGGLLLSQGEQRRVHFEHFKKRLDLCQQLMIPTLVVAADFASSSSGFQAQDLERAVVSLAQAAQWAAGFDVRLALEFRGKASFCASLDTAVALVLQCGEANVGINLDVFHYYTGPSKFEDLAQLPPERLGLVQMCDMTGVPRELATDADRILPGDGDLQLAALVDFLRQIEYDGWVSLELMNPTLWRTPSTLVAKMCRNAMDKLLQSSV
jgi:2-keto-myo-inositol isomerase